MRKFPWNWVVGTAVLAAAGCGAASKQGATSPQNGTPEGATVSAQNGNMGLDSIYPGTGAAATLRLAVVEQGSCQAQSGWTSGQRSWGGGFAWHRSGIWGLRRYWDGGSQSQAAQGTIDGQSLSGSCVVRTSTEAYGSANGLAINNLASGTYDVVVEVDDANGNPLAGGSQTVTVVNGQLAPCSIALGPVPATPVTSTTAAPTGQGGISVSVPGGYSTPATPISTVTPTAPSNADHLVFNAPSMTAHINTCTAVPIVVIDQNGNAFADPNGATLSLTSSSATGGFYVDANCTQRTQTLSLPVGASSLIAYYDDGQPGAPTLTAADQAGVLAAGVANITVISP